MPRRPRRGRWRGRDTMFSLPWHFGTPTGWFLSLECQRHDLQGGYRGALTAGHAHRDYCTVRRVPQWNSLVRSRDDCARHPPWPLARQESRAAVANPLNPAGGGCWRGRGQGLGVAIPHSLQGAAVRSHERCCIACFWTHGLVRNHENTPWRGLDVGRGGPARQSNA